MHKNRSKSKYKTWQNRRTSIFYEGFHWAKVLLMFLFFLWCIRLMIFWYKCQYLMLMFACGIELTVCLKPKHMRVKETHIFPLWGWIDKHAGYLITHIHVMMFSCLVHICTIDWSCFWWGKVMKESPVGCIDFVYSSWLLEDKQELKYGGIW